jgi:hypothetical protein
MSDEIFALEMPIGSYALLGGYQPPLKIRREEITRWVQVDGDRVWSRPDFGTLLVKPLKEKG